MDTWRAVQKVLSHKMIVVDKGKTLKVYVPLRVTPDKMLPWPDTELPATAASDTSPDHPNKMASNLYFILVLCGLWIGENANVAADCHVCPPGWTQFEHHCYVFGHVEKEWADAEHACTLAGGNLASLPNTKVYNFIRDHIHRLTGKHTVSWVGGYDAAKEGVWLWSDGSKFDFKGWHSGEPNNAGGENCMEINFREQSFVNDAKCSFKRSFVCSKSL